jgi:uncharacterized delta-60 repeat protein
MAVTVQPDGKIVAAGRAGENFNTLCSPRCSYALARYNPDGSLDSSFGGGGLVAQGFELPAIAEAVVVQPDGKIVVAGSGRVARFTPAGVLDAAFGSAGSVETTPFSALGVVLDHGSRLVLTGSLAAGTTSRFAVMRLTASGAKDDHFGTPAASATDDHAAAGGVDSHGRIVVAGFAGPDAGPWDFAAATAKLHAAGCSTGKLRTTRAKTAKGRVSAQSASAGTQLAEDTPVDLTVSKGPKR